MNGYETSREVALLIEIERLRAELADVTIELGRLEDYVSDSDRIGSEWMTRADVAEARLAAVIALCDEWESYPGQSEWYAATVNAVRAAATGNTGRAPCDRSPETGEQL